MPATDTAALIQRMLTECDLDQAAVTPLAHTHNQVFQITHEGQRYILRLQPLRRHRLAWQQSEVMLLRHLRRNTPVSAPLPLHTRVDESGFYCTLFDYLPGHALDPADLTAGHMERLGSALAQLHAALRPLDAADYPRPRLDEAGLFGADGLYAPSAAAARLLAPHEARLAQVRAHLRGLAAGPGGLLHGDVLLNNVLFDGEAVRLLDFEYCGTGPYVYDLAPLLWQLKTDVRYPALAAAYQSGYARHAAVDEAALESGIALRHAASMHWIALNHDHPYVAGRAVAILAQRAAELGVFLATGQLQRQP